MLVDYEAFILESFSLRCAMKIGRTTRALVTGAGSGLGKELCRELGRRGGRVLAVDSIEERAQEARELVQQLGGSGDSVCCDVARKEQMASLAERVARDWGGVDLLVNNAGVSVAGRVGSAPLDNWQWVIDIDLWGVIYGCHFFVPLMKRTGGGHIVNIASNAGIASFPEMGPYNVAKAGVISLSETLRAELNAYRIGVSVVCPTFFPTRLLENLRYETEEQYQFAQKMFDLATMDAAGVARCTIRAVEKNKLYVLPQIEARFVWHLKRLFPRTYVWIVGCAYRWGVHRLLLRIKTKKDS